MAEKKGIFSFFSRNTNPVLSAEEEEQRKYALEMKRKEEKEAEEEAYEGPISTEIEAFIQNSLEDMLKHSDFEGKVVIHRKEEDKIFLEIVESDDLGRIIGREGSTLEAFQILLRNFVYNQFDTQVKVILDAGDYRRKREAALKGQALRAARQVVNENRSVELKPMNAAERRIVHMLFKDHKEVKSFSKGDGHNRRIVLDRK